MNYFTKEGLGLGYVGFYSSKRGRRSVSVNVYTINDRLAGGRQTNFMLGEQENISQHLHSNFQFSYQSNYGPLVSIPPERNHQRIDRSSNHADVAELQF